MKKNKIKGIILDSIEKLREERPIFHSEADFQHSLAVKIKEKSRGEDLLIRLEKRVKSGDLKDKNYVDLVLITKNYDVFIELKYKTKLPRNKKKYFWEKEEFLLTNQGAQDLGTYHFFIDIHDLEEITTKNKKKLAFAIFLTNDNSYWRRNGRESIFDEFWINEGREISSRTLKLHPTKRTPNLISRWKNLGGKDNFGKIKIRGNYKFKWKSWSDKPCEFKFLFVDIKWGA